ncbi:MAG: hypothetical protein OXT70_10445 [Chloroflexota bacterium]|nr:hypothetical protein [Chloroflexota bacterium]
MRITTVRLFLVLTLAALATFLGHQIGQAQQVRSTFEFYDVPRAQQAEIQEEWAAVVEWMSGTYGLSEKAIQFHIGLDQDPVADLIVNASPIGRCSWNVSGQRTVVLILPCFRQDVSLAGWYASYQGIGHEAELVVEEGHRMRGPAWLTSHLFSYLDSKFAEHEGADLAAERDRRQIESAKDWGVLESTEHRDVFRSVDPASRELGWLAIDWLAQRAGETSYVEYMTQRGNYPTWEEAFEAKFKISVGVFYEAFAKHGQVVQEEIQRKKRLDSTAQWWRAALDSDRTTLVTFGDGGKFVPWFGIDVPIGWFFETYPHIGLVAQWASEHGRFVGAIRDVSSTHSAIPEIRRNSVIFVAPGQDGLTKLRLPTAVHNRIRLSAGGSFVPWLGDNEEAISDIRASVNADEVLLLIDEGGRGSQQSKDGDTVQTANAGDLLWVVVSEPFRWIQSPIEPRPAIDADGTIALLDNPEAAEIAETELTVRVGEGSVDDQDIEVIKARLADGIAFFRERFDTPRLFLEVKIHGPEVTDGVPCGDAGINVYLWCRDWTISGLGTQPASTEMMVHEYFHRLQGHWNSDHAVTGGRQILTWLVEGSAMYSEIAYWRYRGFASASDQHMRRLEYSRGVPDSLVSLSQNWPWESDLPIYNLSYLAVHWLVEHSGNPDSWLEFWYPWNGRDRFEVFEEVFGISLDDFYQEFGKWRNENYPPHQ